MWPKVKFIILLILLLILFSPLFIMFYTAFIPQGDPFHLIKMAKITDFEVPSAKFAMFYLKRLMSTVDGAKWKVVEDKDASNMYLEVTIPESGSGLSFTTGNKNMYVVASLAMRMKNTESVKVKVIIKDVFGTEGELPEVEIGSSNSWKEVSIPFDFKKITAVSGKLPDLERSSRIYLLFYPENSKTAKIYIDDLYYKNKFPTLYNFKRVLKYDMFGRYLLNSAIIATSVVLGNIILSSMVGYAFARKKFMMKEFLFAIILGMMMIPPQTTIIPVFILMKKLHWIDTYWALIIPALVTPFGVFLMRQYIEQIPVSLDEAARVDGASDFQIFWRIIMPLSKAPLAVLGINVFIGSWNDLFYPLILTTSKEMRTVQLGLAMYQKLNTDWPSLMAASSIAGLPVIIIYLIFQRKIIEGVLKGAVKG
ncbi:MAG: carbohydrate ABC transporter permease [Thermotogaceae bacterium]|nr:carbohydrate ABC transporter permease [Thermotogaceae bacterium]